LQHIHNNRMQGTSATRRSDLSERV
jgi:hypothetical protein